MKQNKKYKNNGRPANGVKELPLGMFYGYREVGELALGLFGTTDMD